MQRDAFLWERQPWSLGLLLSPSGCCLCLQPSVFFPLPFNVITLMWTQNYILSSLNMAVISGSRCYRIGVWVHTGLRDDGGRRLVTWLLVTEQRDVMCDGIARILGAEQIRQFSGKKSNIKLTSGRPGGPILVEVQSGSRWRGEDWRLWRGSSPLWGEIADGESCLFYFLPQQGCRLFHLSGSYALAVASWFFFPHRACSDCAHI